MNKKLMTPEIFEFYDAVLSLKDKEECAMCCEGACAVKELLALAQRVEVAKMLRQGKTYLEITDKTSASTATISRVNRCLQYGAGGYKIVLDRLKKE